MPWVKGQSGNPKGRPQTARQKLSESFVSDLQAAWKESGKEIIKRMVEEDPAKLLDAIVKIIPKQIEAEISHTINALDLSDDELAAIARGSSGGVIATEASEEQPSCVH
jgi:hypothetical protein